MKAIKILIDNTDILAKGIYYTNRQWLALSASDESRDIAGMHARYVSPTYARVRTITIEGVIDRTESDKEAVEHLQYLFRLQGSQSSEVETREVKITDEYGDTWTIRAKVKEPLIIEEGNNEFEGWYYRWRIVMESVGGAEYQSDGELRSPSVGYGTEGMYGGVKFGMKLGSKWNHCIASISVATPSDTPLKIILEATGEVNAPIIILNNKTGAKCIIDANMSPRDIIEVNSREMTITKNGANITNSRVLGSVFPTANGPTKLIITDVDGRIQSDDLRVYALYNKVLL